LRGALRPPVGAVNGVCKARGLLSAAVTVEAFEDVSSVKRLVACGIAMSTGSFLIPLLPQSSKLVTSALAGRGILGGGRLLAVLVSSYL